MYEHECNPKNDALKITMYNFHIFLVFKLGKMCQVSKCCCCVDLRTGAIVMAILQLIGGAGMFANGGAWQDILNAVVGIGAGACLLFGAIKYNQMATLVYLVFQMIAIVLIGVAMLVAIIGGTAVTVAVSGDPDLHQGNQDVQDAVQVGGAIVIVMACVMYGIYASFYIYFWVCVFSFYKGLKTGEIASPA